MVWLAIHMWIFLLGAFALGLFFGRWIWRSKAFPTLTSTGEVAADPNRDVLGSLDNDNPETTQQ